VSATLHIGCAAGFSGDRTDAAGPVVASLAKREGARYLIFETLAERTLALAQLARRADPAAGYEPLLDDLIEPILGACLANGIRIVSNFGAANPQGAARRILAIAAQQRLRAPRIAVVSGDDVSGDRGLLREALGERVDHAPVAAANAYLGAEPIAAALQAGAQIVVCGRVADPSLAVGPAMAHYGWRVDDWDRLGRATMAGHLLECGAQVTGGYFADPGFKDVPDLHAVGFPIAQIDADGRCVIGKADATGGAVRTTTVKEQLLYEVHDPAAYVTPDVTADIGDASVREVARDRVALDGVRGHARPERLKVTVCVESGWLAEGEISYAGRGAEARARLAAEILRTRLAGCGPLRVDLIGVASVFGDDGGRWLADQPISDARDVRLRVAMNHADRAVALRLTREVTALYTCGPAGGGGVRTALRERLGTVSCNLPREHVPQRLQYLAP
jgi:acyclic terpene utilization AtuA family protein